MASAEEILAALDEIEGRLTDINDVDLDADVATLHTAIRAAASQWTRHDGLRVLCRGDQVVLQALQRRSEISVLLGQQRSSKRAAARYASI